MFSSRYTAFIDACALVGVLKRNVLLSLAEAEFFRIAWSNEVLAEVEHALVRLHRQRGHNDPSSIAHFQIARMRDAFPEACVQNFKLHQEIKLPDPNDLHVLAAAIKAQAATIVTDNISDFPRRILDPFDIEAKTCDQFISDMITLDPHKSLFVIRTMRLRFQNPNITPEALLAKMKAARLTKTASILRDFKELL